MGTAKGILAAAFAAFAAAAISGVALAQSTSYSAFVNSLPALPAPAQVTDKVAAVRGSTSYAASASAFGGNILGTPPTTIGGLACWLTGDGNSLGDCTTITTRNTWSNTITGDSGAQLVGGVQMTTNSNSATALTDIGKINGLYVHHIFGTPAPAGEGQRAGIFAHLTQTGAVDFTSANYHFNTGSWAWVQVLQGNTVVGTEPTYHGFGGLVELGGTGSRAFNMHGAEVDVNIGASAVAGNRIGYLAAIGAGTFLSPTRATDFDGAFAVGRASAADAAWKYGYMARGPNGVWPFAGDSVLYGGLGASNSAVPPGSPAVPALAGTGIDFTGIDFSFQQYISDNFQITADGTLYQFNSAPTFRQRDTNIAVTAGGLIQFTGIQAGGWCQQINTAVAGDFSTVINSYCITTTGGIGLEKEFKLATRTIGAGVNQLPTCNGGMQGASFSVNDAAAAPVYNANVAGGGTVGVLAYCDGTNWTNH